MLELKQIVKDYVSGNETVHALRGITLSFRKSEFAERMRQDDLAQHHRRAGSVYQR